MSGKLDRRHFMAGAAGVALAGCDRVASSDAGKSLFERIGDLTYAIQRTIRGEALAPEYPASQISKFFKPNGSIDPKDPAYRKLAAEKFASYSLPVSGLVEKPRAFTLAELRDLDSRTQITRHDCVEGWSCIGQWTGVPLGTILDLVLPKVTAKYVVFRCFDRYDTDWTKEAPSDDGSEKSDQDKGPVFYGSIGIDDAHHPQTILAYDMNGQPLPVEHGAPLRVRVERQLGYKMTKYIKSIELVDDFSKIGEGKGGYWEDSGYDWYGGI